MVDFKYYILVLSNQTYTKYNLDTLATITGSPNIKSQLLFHHSPRDCALGQQVKFIRKKITRLNI